ncbi:MAG TPA: ABC transporter permease [Anaerolineales bacterium]
MTLAAYLALKEIWRNRARFLSVALVIALITLLVLFIAALGEGLGTNNRQYIANLDAQLMVFLDKSDYIISASRLDQSTLKSVRRVDGVADAGPISTASTAILLADGKVLKVSMLGVEADRPGQPKIVEGRTFKTQLARETIIDRNVALRSNIKVGDEITIRSTQGTQDEFFRLQVVGLTEGQAYLFAPTIFVPPSTWERVRPKSGAEANKTIPDINVIAVRLQEPMSTAAMREIITKTVSNVQAADIETTIQNIPGYSAQQGTVQTQAVFTLLIGVLVIGGFFQIQILQKVPQIGVLKAIGSSNGLVGGAAVLQIMIVTALGVGLGGLFTYVFSLFFPPTIPLVFNGQASAAAIAALLIIGPVGGMVSVIYAVRIEPLKALRLS